MTQVKRDQIQGRIESWVLGIHRRNGGVLRRLNPDFTLLAPELGIDSLDLAEVMILVEKEFGVSPFECGRPRTWRELAELVNRGRESPGGSRRSQ